jgi:nucleoside-diphosphate-sugar epimerase
MRYAMTGATGFLGGALARMLIESGHEVVALVRRPEAAADLRELGVTLVEGDLDDDQALDRLLAGADGFFHVAGWFKFGRREQDQLHAVNVHGTRNALEAARRAGVRTVYTSTIALNSDTHGETVDENYRFTGRHLTEYDRTKGLAHEVALEYADSGLPVVIVQPSVIYGPGDTSTLGEISRRVAAGRFTPGPKSGGACWVHVDDAAAGHVLAMEKGVPGESYILAGEAATYVEALGNLARLTGGRKPFFLPRWMVRAAARTNGLVERVVRLPSDMTREAMLASTATYYADSGKARRELGWTRRSLEDGFQDTYVAR